MEVCGYIGCGERRLPFFGLPLPWLCRGSPECFSALSSMTEIKKRREQGARESEGREVGRTSFPLLYFPFLDSCAATCHSTPNETSNEHLSYLYLCLSYLLNFGLKFFFDQKKNESNSRYEQSSPPQEFNNGVFEEVKGAIDF